ncbi:MAG: hypothetical protein N2746_03865 [Deltaproteobacteria bacterium]|nr:hypothetical protein [Deltaproteobacteria bacterium]
MKDVKGETLLRETIKKVKSGSLIHTDVWKGDDSLLNVWIQAVWGG